MKLAIKATLAALALAAPIATFAAARLTPLGDDQFRSITAGESQQQVRETIGRPNLVRAESDGFVHWLYTYTDSFGDTSTADVAFDHSGQVAEASPGLSVSP